MELPVGKNSWEELNVEEGRRFEATIFYVSTVEETNIFNPK